LGSNSAIINTDKLKQKMAHPSHQYQIHHINRRKATKTVDRLAYTVGVLGNIAVVPQIVKAWQSEAPGLAILTWVLFTLIGFVWLAYAVLHKQRPLIVAQCVGISVNLLVVSGWLVNNIIR
jgi:uncharacterized protein with PQ loop repeat